MNAAIEHLDVVVIGGGQAGLAIGHPSPSGPAVHDPGGRRTSRRRRGARAGTRCSCSPPCATTACPGCRSPATPTPTRASDDVVAYLPTTRADFELPVELNSPVRGVRRRRRAATSSRLDDRALRGRPGRSGHRAVPGPARARRRRAPRPGHGPAPQQRLPDAGRRCPTGRCSWSAAATPAIRSPRSCRARTRCISRSAPARPRCRSASLGRDLFRYLEATGLMGKTADSRIGRRMQARETLIGSSPRAARRHGIRIHGADRRDRRPRRHLRRRRQAATDRRRLGDRLRARPLVDRRAGLRRQRRTCGTTAASPRSPGCPSWASRGSTRAAPRCWAGSRTTPSTSPAASARPPSQHP